MNDRQSVLLIAVHLQTSQWNDFAEESVKRLHFRALNGRPLLKLKTSIDDTTCESQINHRHDERI